jgi:hypothetical protein
VDLLPRGKYTQNVGSNYEKIPFDNDELVYTIVINGFVDIVGSKNDSSNVLDIAV